MNITNRDYTRMTEMAARCGMVPYIQFNKVVPGRYTVSGLEAPVDLSACAENEKSILRTAVRQLSEEVDEIYWESIRED